ncbi:MAG: multiheme c-type cytochrome [Syntrophales bacterium]
MRLNRPANARTAARRGTGEPTRSAPSPLKIEAAAPSAADSLPASAIHRPCRAVFLFALSLLCLLLSAFHAGAQGEKSYVGAEACKGCHEKEHTSFATHSKMSNSFHSISRMKRGLTGEEMKKCYECHTTGYGKPGGFRSEAETPGLKNLGCEACHGPGSSHASSGNPKEIKTHLEIKDCEMCHARDRVAAFNYKPLLFGGAH